MNKLKIQTNPEVDSVFQNYPDFVQKQMADLRQIIIETAEETESISVVEETLKWGEPAYLTKYGSTLRIDWKEKKPDQYAVYFKCTSKLVSSFQEVFKDSFNYEGTRAIVFSLHEEIPVAKLKKCIRSALTYHKVKHLDLLGL